jgi:hypothetical protein
MQVTFGPRQPRHGTLITAIQTEITVPPGVSSANAAAGTHGAATVQGDGKRKSRSVNPLSTPSSLPDAFFRESAFNFGAFCAHPLPQQWCCPVGNSVHGADAMCRLWPKTRWLRTRWSSPLSARSKARSDSLLARRRAARRFRERRLEAVY